MAQNKPRVFLSSTVRDLHDLRGALRYWLSEAGFSVISSEFNDLPIDLTKGTIENCLELVRSCDYFILLIGFRKGFAFDQDQQLTITRAEYREAYQKAQTGNCKLLTLIRSEVDQAILSNQGAQFEDYEFTKSFVAEVERRPETQVAREQGKQFPKANWVFRFDDFSDIVSTVTATLQIGTRLRRLALQANLVRELRANLLRLLNKYKGTIRIESEWFRRIQNDFPLDTVDLMDSIQLNEQQARNLAWGGTYMVLQDTLLRDTLEEAINSGEFLDYDVAKDDYTCGVLCIAPL